MKRIGILTAGGDTPALNATIFGAVVQANRRKVEVVGLIKGFSSLFNPSTPHVVLNPLFSVIPELDATVGGTILGASRDYVNPDETDKIKVIAERLRRLGIEGLICVGGDGTLNGLQPLTELIPTVLAPKTIDNDLGLNYHSEPDEFARTAAGYDRKISRDEFALDEMVNYVTPGFATAVFVTSWGVQRIRTTAESHRRIGIVEVMGRHSGYIALGSAYGQPDIILIPEVQIDLAMLVERIKEIYNLQKNVLIVCGEGIKDKNGEELGAEYASTDPAGNKILSGAAEALRMILMDRIGDAFFRDKRRAESARAAIFTRKVGHTQRGGRPILFDRFYASQLGGHAVDMLLQGQNNCVSTLQWSKDEGFELSDVHANKFRDRWGLIHARQVHPSFYDAKTMRPSAKGIEYLRPIFDKAIGHDDVEYIRESIFDPGNLLVPFHSVNTDIHKRIRYLGSMREGS